MPNPSLLENPRLSEKDTLKMTTKTKNAATTARTAAAAKAGETAMGERIASDLFERAGKAAAAYTVASGTADAARADLADLLFALFHGEGADGAKSLGYTQDKCVVSWGLDVSVDTFADLCALGMARAVCGEIGSKRRPVKLATVKTLRRGIVSPEGRAVTRLPALAKDASFRGRMAEWSKPAGKRGASELEAARAVVDAGKSEGGAATPTGRALDALVRFAKACKVHGVDLAALKVQAASLGVDLGDRFLEEAERAHRAAEQAAVVA